MAQPVPHRRPIRSGIPQKVIDLFVNAIYLYDDSFKLFLNVADSSQVTYADALALAPPSVSDFGASGVPDMHLSEHIIFVNGVIGMIVQR